MIFVTVGTHHAPFTRAELVALGLWAGEEIVIQHGHTPCVRTGPRVRWHRWLQPAEVSGLMREAALVVTHGGVATVVEAIDAGHRPVVVPRRQHLREHVDDHQLEIVKALSELGLITPWTEDDDVATVPIRRGAVAGGSAWPPPGLKSVIRAAVERS